MIKKWKTVSKYEREDYKIFKTFNVLRESENSGKSSEFYLVEPPNWITIIPVLKNDANQDCFLMVKQYRHGSDSITLEFPAGMVDPGEDALETAIRELSEETGYYSSDIKLVGEVSPNAAFMTNITSTFVARNLVKVGEQHLDEHEEIETLLVPITEFDKMITGVNSYKTQVNSAIMIQAYFFYLRSLSPNIFNLGEGS